MKEQLQAFFNPETRQQVTVVRDPMRFFAVRIAVVFGVLVAIVISFYVGEYFSTRAAFERDALQNEKAQLLKELEDRDRQIALMDVDKKVNLLAVEQVRKDNLDLQNKVSDLENDLLYYQRLMNPIKNDKGLRIDTLEILPTSDERRYRFNAVLTQLGQKNRSVIKGKIKLEVHGSLNGEKTSFSFDKLKLPDGGLALKFRFRYYQEIDGEIELPEGFVAEYVEMEAASSGKKRMKMTKTIDWPSMAH